MDQDDLFIQNGLTSEQAAKAEKNHKQKSTSLSVGQILLRHICTLFNLVNMLLAAALIAVGSYKNTLFILIVLTNLLIGIVQELRSKRAVDKLSVINAVKVTAVRDGVQHDISVFDVAKGDLLILSHGHQVPADCTVLQGELEADESCVTGESDGIKKQKGDCLYAGSFVLGGSAKVRVTAVGENCYTASLAREGKKHIRPDSQIMNTLRRIIFILSICVIPVGAVTFFIQYSVQSGDIAGTVTATAAAVLGMIPDGLVLLTSTVLAVSMLRLTRKKVLVQELHCIENLARVDVLCLDKTGTLTEGRMTVEDVIPLAGSPDGIRRDCARLIGALPDNNATYRAMSAHFGTATANAEQIRSFNSKNKWSGARFGDTTLVWGAPEYVLPDMSDELNARILSLSQSKRVLLLARGDAPFPEEGLPPLTPYAIITLRDVVRPEAAGTLEYFREQGVDVYVFSGDGKATVERIASDCGIPGEALDVSSCPPEELENAVKHFKLFARVSPLQKQLLVECLKKEGHTVAFIGDGVNDVPALKASDCSVAMGNGTDAARGIAQLVLLTNNFAALPAVVAEGRRSINNLQRSAALFLIKTIYASLLAFLFMLIGRPYPFMPIQMSLLSSTGIGIPSFILALEPNRERVSGTFFSNILYRCIPGGVTVFVGICLLYLSQLIPALTVSGEMLSSGCVMITGFVFMINLCYVSSPLNLLRSVLLASMCILFTLGILLFPQLFGIVAPSLTFAAVLLTTAAAELGLFNGLRLLLAYLRKTGRCPV